MTNERAAEILDPNRRTTCESAESVTEACRMGMEALRNPLLAFIRQEVPFRLKEILEVPANEQTPELVEEIAGSLYDASDVMFDYDKLDSFIAGILDKKNVEHN